MSSGTSYGLTKIVGRIFLLLIIATMLFGVYVFVFYDGTFGIEFLSDDKIKEKVETKLLQDYALRDTGLVLLSKQPYTSCFDPSTETCNVEREALNVYVYTFTGVGKDKKTMTVTYRSPFFRNFIPSEEEINIEYPTAKKKS